jgi:hypothetical protein
LIEIMQDAALPPALVGHRVSFSRLAGNYNAVNARLGPVGMRSLQDTTAAIEGGDGAYLAFQVQLGVLANEHDAIAGHMRQMMEASKFDAVPFDDITAGGSGLGAEPAATSPVISACLTAREEASMRPPFKTPFGSRRSAKNSRRKREPTPRCR